MNFRKEVEAAFTEDHTLYSETIDRIVALHDKALAEQRSRLRESLENEIRQSGNVTDKGCCRYTADQLLKAFDEPNG